MIIIISKRGFVSERVLIPENPDGEILNSSHPLSPNDHMKDQLTLIVTGGHGVAHPFMGQKKCSKVAISFGGFYMVN